MTGRPLRAELRLDGAQRLPDDRFLAVGEAGAGLARELYEHVAALPILSPHGHIEAALLANPDARLDPPGRLVVTTDHYVLRVLYSHGVPLEDLGVPPRDGGAYETDDRVVWRRFCDGLHLFSGTPVKLWLQEMLVTVFGIDEPLSAESADAVYDRLEERLASREYSPRALLDRFGVEMLATTDSAGSALEHHRRLHAEGWGGRIRPTFRPDAVVDVLAPGWLGALQQLEAASDIPVVDYASFLDALEERRAEFRELGGTATDHGATSAATERLEPREAAAIFANALAGTATPAESAAFGAHMLGEFARMSVEDGLVMQLHAGSMRDHNEPLARRFGPDIGGDIPIAIDWTRGLKPMLNEFGNEPGFRLIPFTLDESTYSRELAPLAAHYPAIRLGSPWWFNDSPEGIARYLTRVVETAGLYNLAGFVDDARSLPIIPVRHDLWRRLTCGWLSRQATTGVIGEEEAFGLATDLACGLVRRAYRLEEA